MRTARRHQVQRERGRHGGLRVVVEDDPQEDTGRPRRTRAPRPARSRHPARPAHLEHGTEHDGQDADDHGRGLRPRAGSRVRLRGRSTVEGTGRLRLLVPAGPEMRGRAPAVTNYSPARRARPQVRRGSARRSRGQRTATARPPTPARKKANETLGRTNASDTAVNAMTPDHPYISSTARRCGARARAAGGAGAACPARTGSGRRGSAGPPPAAGRRAARPAPPPAAAAAAAPGAGCAASRA